MDPQAILRAQTSFDHWQLCDSRLEIEIQFAATEESQANWVTWGSNLSPLLQPDEQSFLLLAAVVAVQGEPNVYDQMKQPIPRHCSKSVKSSTDFWNVIRQVSSKNDLPPVWLKRKEMGWIPQRWPHLSDHISRRHGNLDEEENLSSLSQTLLWF